MTYIKGRNSTVPNIDAESLLILQRYIGQVIESYNLFPQFCYLKDTSLTGITDNLEAILEFPIIIVECTFYAEDDMVQAQSKFHIHWNQLEPIMTEHTSSLWVLIHHSKKYKREEIISLLQNKYGTSWELPSHILIW